MNKKVNIKNRIKMLSWVSVIGFFVMSAISFYNSLAYLKNLDQVKIIIDLVNKDTSQEIKTEIIQTIEQSITLSQNMSYLFLIFGMLLLAFVVYLGISIKKETNKRIHAMDWIIED
ncbi:MAG TPA: hypothetical protein EYG69_00680 [Campylobacterales bacterium]|nr:hypothetical protein [Campylobacterales bacterium]